MVLTTKHPQLKHAMYSVSRIKLLLVSALVLLSISMLLSFKVYTKLMISAQNSVDYDAPTIQSIDASIQKQGQSNSRSLIHNNKQPISTLPKYDKTMAATAIRKVDWICGDEEPMTSNPNRPFIVFVHIYKTAGSTLREFFASYAYICNKALMLLVGCTETFQDSILILEQALLPNVFSSGGREERLEEIFDAYVEDVSENTVNATASDNEEEGDDMSNYIDTRKNVSQMGSISTSSVVAELKRDDEFMPVITEFLKYEQTVVDFALKMHRLQYDMVIQSNEEEDRYQ